MDTHCEVQTYFSFRDDREIRIDFAGGRITSDAGLIGRREFEHRIRFTDQIVQRLGDERHPS